MKTSSPRRGHGDGPYILWCNSGCRGSWILTRGITSCITATLTLFLSTTTPSSVSLLLIPLVFNCRTLNVLSSLICSADGAGFGVSKSGGGVDCWVFEAEQGSQVQSFMYETTFYLIGTSKSFLVSSYRSFL